MRHLANIGLLILLILGLVIPAHNARYGTCVVGDPGYLVPGLGSQERRSWQWGEQLSTPKEKEERRIPGLL